MFVSLSTLGFIVMSDTRYNSLNPRLFQLVEPNKRVLDVGCASGLLGKELKQQKNCHMVGIEIEERAARKATNIYDRVVVADIEYLETIPFSRKYFDIIVLGDVLEHLKNPEKVLQMLREYLADNGYVLISVPNVAHWRIRLKLLFGKFNYSKYGILDENHLRFYTQKTFKQMVEQCGYRVERLEGFGFLWSNIWRGLLASAFIIKALKKQDI